MSTVTNPYTFNIKSNCKFSTNALISNNAYTAKLTMIYTNTDDDIILSYSNGSNNGSSINPSVINGIDILGITLTYSKSNGELKCLIIVAGQNYSKIILNGGPFNNMEFPFYNNIGVTGMKSYLRVNDKDNIVGTDLTYWEYYSGVPFDLTIEFV